MDVLSLLAVAMLLVCPLAGGGRRRSADLPADPWEPAGGWIWLLPAVLAVLGRWG